MEGESYKVNNFGDGKWLPASNFQVHPCSTSKQLKPTNSQVFFSHLISFLSTKKKFALTSDIFRPCFLITYITKSQLPLGCFHSAT